MNVLGYWGDSLAAVIVLSLMACAGSDGGLTIGGWPLFATGVAFALLLQWVSFGRVDPVSVDRVEHLERVTELLREPAVISSIG